MAVLIIPVVYQRSLGTLRYFSISIFVIIIYTIVVTIIQTPEYYRTYQSNEKYEIDWIASDYEPKWFQGWATMMLSYNSQVLFFYVRGEMIHKSKRRVMKVVRYLLTIVCSILVLMSICGYISLGKNLIPKLYTLRRKTDENSMDLPMTIA